MVFENRSYASVRAPPLPIIRDHSKHQHKQHNHSSARISPDSAAALKCHNGTTNTTTTTTSQLFNLTTTSKGLANGRATPTARCTPATTTTTNGTRPTQTPIGRSTSSLTFQAGRLRRAQRKPLTIREYESDFRLQASDLRLVERIFYGGMEGNQLRAALWPYVFGLVSERGHFVPRTSSSINGFGHATTTTTTMNGHTNSNGTGQQNRLGSRGASRSTRSSGGQYVYIEHEKNVERWRELKQLYKTYKRQWRSIQPDQELRFSVFRERKSLIERDVVRSDRTHPFYAHDSEQAAANLKALTTLLMTYMMYDFDIGYLQGMSDLAAPILYVYEGDVVKSFWVFVEVMKLFRRNFEQSQKSIHFQLNCLNRLIKMTDPKLANYLRENDCSNCFFVFRCIVCQFKRELMKSSSSRAASQEEVNGGGGGGGAADDVDGDEQHSDLTSSTEDDDDDDDGCSSLDGGLRRHNGATTTTTTRSASSSSSSSSLPQEDSYARVLNLWDTIWSVQRRHELLAESRYVHTYRIANGGRKSAQHKHTTQHHNRAHQNNTRHHHHHHQRMSSPINISSTMNTTTTTTTSTNGTSHVKSPPPYHNGSALGGHHQRLSSPSAHNSNHSTPRSPSSTTSTSVNNSNATATSTTARLNQQLNRGGRQSPKLTITTNGGHPNSSSPTTTTTTTNGRQQQFLKRHSVGSLSSLGSCCSQCCGQPAVAANGNGNGYDGSRTAPVKQEEIVYTKETFYSSFDPNQADVPRFELTETEKFVLALCVSLIRRERNAILSQQMGVSEIHQHFINPPRLGENFDAFTEQAYETYEYLNTDCDLQLLVKGASELSGGAASDLSPICGAGATTTTTTATTTTTNTNTNTTSGAHSTTATMNSADTADTFDLLKDYFVISPTAYNVSMNSLNNLHSSLSNSQLAMTSINNNNSFLISSTTHNNNNNNSISTSDLNGGSGLGGGSGGGLKRRLSYCGGGAGGGGGGSSGGSVSQKLWDHFLNSKTLNMQ